MVECKKEDGEGNGVAIDPVSIRVNWDFRHAGAAGVRMDKRD